jgi:hypothetical protein
MRTLLEYAPLWAPALVAFVGMIAIFTIHNYRSRH